MTAVTDGGGGRGYTSGDTPLPPKGMTRMMTVLRYAARQPGMPILALCFVAMTAALIKSGVLG